MVSIECDFSPLKDQLKEYMLQISHEIKLSMEASDNDNYCLLSEF